MHVSSVRVYRRCSWPHWSSRVPLLLSRRHSSLGELTASGLLLPAVSFSPFLAMVQLVRYEYDRLFDFVFQFLILAKAGREWDKFFVNRKHLLTGGIFSGLFVSISVLHTYTSTSFIRTRVHGAFSFSYHFSDVHFVLDLPVRHGPRLLIASQSCIQLFVASWAK